MDLLIVLLYILFVLAAIVLIVVVLLQEGRGGGLTDALGTSGQQTFGVGASGINRFTGAATAVFLGSALLIHVMNRHSISSGVMKDITTPEASAPPAGPTPPPGGNPIKLTPMTPPGK